MTRRTPSLPAWLRGGFLALLALVALSLVGCADPVEAGSDRDRPWNEPQGWEHGMPPGMYEGRR